LAIDALAIDALAIDALAIDAPWKVMLIVSQRPTQDRTVIEKNGEVSSVTVALRGHLST
jgi:hypothetical protein